MIEVSNLTKRYGDNLAVNNISFKVDEGEILGFLGPNGAGKSTTMNILTGYLSSTEGTVKINGYDILEEPNEAKKLIGYLPELPPLYLEMTVKEYLEFVYELKKCKLPRDKHLKEICDLVKIDGVYQRLIRNLSKGYRQRVGIAQALVGNPKLLILDEPTVGLDPKQIIEIRNLIKQLGKEHTVILSSHILSEVQAVCERIIIISKGNLVADDTPDNLSKNLSSDHKLIARIKAPENETLKVLQKLPNIVSAVSLGQREPGVYEYAIEGIAGSDLRLPLFERLCDRHWPLLGLKSSELSLEDIFLRLTNDSPLDQKEMKRIRRKQAAIKEKKEENK